MTNISIPVQGQVITVTVIDPEFDFARLNLITNQTVNIIASGASINQVDFTDICHQPCLFVNGSIALTQQQVFRQAVGYVITDPRFIRHNLAILQTCYQAQCPLFITQSVLLQLAEKSPEFLKNFHGSVYVIFAVDRPITDVKKPGFLQRIFTKKLALNDFQHSAHHVIEATIGVSLDIRYGFVEAGTVAFVATQLTFSMGFKQIMLFGVDLVNANEPRFYENPQNTAPSKLEPAIYNRIVPSFDLLIATYRTRGTQVINRSPLSCTLF